MQIPRLVWTKIVFNKEYIISLSKWTSNEISKEPHASTIVMREPNVKAIFYNSMSTNIEKVNPLEKAILLMDLGPFLRKSFLWMVELP